MPVTPADQIAEVATMTLLKRAWQRAPVCLLLVVCGMLVMALFNQRTYATALDMQSMGNAMESQIAKRFDILEKRQDISDSKALIESFTREVHDKEREQEQLEMLMTQLDGQQSPDALTIIQTSLFTLKQSIEDLRSRIQSEQTHLRGLEAEYRRLSDQ